MKLSKKSEAICYFEKILNLLHDVKIKSVFTFGTVTCWSNEGFPRYDSDSEVYVLFENEMCLVFEYYEIDSLTVEYRAMTNEEKEWYRNETQADLFNSLHDICDYRTYEKIYNERRTLEYDSVKCIELKSVEYEKCIGVENRDVKPTEDTFSDIIITMNNEKSFVMSPTGLLGGCDLEVWSEDCKNEVVYY